MKRKLHILALTAVSPGLRGALNNWYLEVMPGIFVGTTNQRIREHVEHITATHLDLTNEGYGTAIHQNPQKEQGFTITTLGSNNPYVPVDHQGLTLISREKVHTEETHYGY